VVYYINCHLRLPSVTIPHTSHMVIFHKGFSEPFRGSGKQTVCRPRDLVCQFCRRERALRARVHVTSSEAVVGDAYAVYSSPMDVPARNIRVLPSSLSTYAPSPHPQSKHPTLFPQHTRSPTLQPNNRILKPPSYDKTQNKNAREMISTNHTLSGNAIPLCMSFPYPSRKRCIHRSYRHLDGK
jgi:hypothetical protein